jgi:hypothetical protein
MFVPGSAWEFVPAGFQRKPEELQQQETSV